MNEDKYITYNSKPLKDIMNGNALESMPSADAAAAMAQSASAYKTSDSNQPKKKFKFGVDEGIGMGAGALSAILGLLTSPRQERAFNPVHPATYGAASITGGQGYNAGALQKQYGMNVDPYRSDAIFQLLNRGG